MSNNSQTSSTLGPLHPSGLTDEEWIQVTTRLGRNPTEAESTLLGFWWSEELAFKSSALFLSSFYRGTKSTVQTLRGTSSRVAHIGNGQSVSIKVVSNNRSFPREPRLSASESLSRGMEEIAALGLSPICALSLARLGSPDQVETIHTLKGMTEGLSEFANTCGIPLVSQDVYFHSRFDTVALFNCAVLGIGPTALFTETQANAGDFIYYINISTPYRSGATEMSLGSYAASPLSTSCLTEALIEGYSKGCISHASKIALGGVAISALELSQRALSTLHLDANKVSRASGEENLLKTLFNDRPNRALVIVPESKQTEATEVFRSWDLQHSVVGEITNADAVVFSYNHQPAVDIPFFMLDRKGTAKTHQLIKYPPMLKEENSALALNIEELHSAAGALEDTWADLLANPNVCSRLPLVQSYDIFLGGDTSRVTDSKRALIRIAKPAKESAATLGIGATICSKTLFMDRDPYLGTVHAVAEAMRSLACIGATPIAVSDCLNLGSPDRYKELCDIAETMRGLGDSCRYWEIPVLLDWIDLGNGTERRPIIPTPTISMVGLVDDVSKSPASHFKNSGDVVFVLGITKDELGCSEYATYYLKQAGGALPDINFDWESAMSAFICMLVQQNLLSSAITLGSGGLAAGLSQLCLKRPQPIGLTLTLLENQEPLRPDSLLFSESASRYIVSFDEKNQSKVESLCKQFNIPITAKGIVGGKTIKLDGQASLELPLATAFRIWSRALLPVFGERDSSDAS